MTVTPASFATSRPVNHAAVPMPAAQHAADAETRRSTRGDLLTVDPADRRRRAQTALLELVVTRSAGRRRV